MLKVNNLNQPDNKKLKFIADIALYALLLINPLIVTMPVSDNIQKWVLFGLNLAVIGFKTLSKFTSDETESPA